MPVASGPYKKLIPLINTEDVRLKLDRAGARLGISVRLSNEVGSLSKKVTRFGNFVFLTHSRTHAMALCTDIEMLTALIKRPNYEQKNSQILELTAKHFEKKPVSIEPAGLRQYVHRYTHQVNLQANNQGELYLVVASYRSYKNRISIGNVLRETLLTSGKVPRTSTIYRLEESVTGYGTKGAIWPGAVHRNGTDIMAGNLHVRTKHPRVSSERVPNIKVKDMRIIKLAYARQPEFRAVDTGATFVSPLEVSRNAIGVINGMFSFDMLRYVEANSPLSRIMSNETSLLDSLELKDIGIWAKTSGQGTAKGNSLTPVAKKSCGIHSVEGFKKVASLNNGCEVLDTDNNGNEIIEVSFVDDNSRGMNSGFKEYRVEILMSNNAKEVVDNMTTELRDYITQIQNSLQFPALSARTAYYAPERMINLYLDALHYLFGNEAFAPYTRNYWKGCFIAMFYGSGIDMFPKHAVLRIVETFISSLNKLIQKTGMSTVAATSHQSKMGASKTQPLLNFRYKFDNKLEFQGDANVGLGYVDDVISNLDTVTPQITFADYDGRTAEEVDKYNINDPESANINKYGFLSPSFVGLGSKTTVDTRGLQLGVDSFLSLARSRMSLSPVQDTKPRNDDAINKLEILQSQGVSIVPLKVSLKKEVIAPLIVNAQIIPAGDILGRSSKFYTQNLKALEVSGSQRSIIRKKGRKDLTKSPLVSKMVNKSITKFKPQKTVKNSSLLKGSIALAKTQQDPTIVKESDSMTAITNYGSLAQVQYLAPYKKGTGVKKQNWKTLDKHTFEKAKKENKSLVCRTTKITNTVDGNSQVELKALSSIFTLGQPLIKNTSIRNAPTIPRTPGDSTMDSFIVRNLGGEILYSKNISLPASTRSMPSGKPTAQEPLDCLNQTQIDQILNMGGSVPQGRGCVGTTHAPSSLGGRARLGGKGGKGKTGSKSTKGKGKTGSKSTKGKGKTGSKSTKGKTGGKMKSGRLSKKRSKGNLGY
jgi:hypothetical protein